MFKSRGKYLIVILLLFISTLGIVGVKYYLNQKSLTIFTDDDWHFSFKYNPDSWQEVSEDERKTKFPDVNFAFKKIRSTKTVFTIKVSKKEGKEEMNIEGSIKDLDDTLPERLKEFDKIGSKEIKFLGVPAIDYTFRYNYQPIELLPKDVGIQREIIFFKDEILYTLMLSADPVEFDSENKEFQEMLNSFKVLPH